MTGVENIPPRAILKCVNSYARLKRLRELPNVPPVILENEERILGEGLDALMALAIEHGLRPSEASIEAARAEDGAQVAAMAAKVRAAIGEQEDDSIVLLTASRFVDWKNPGPSPEQIRAVLAQVKAEEEQGRREQDGGE